MNGIDGAWLDDSEKQRLRREFEAELAELDAQLEQGAAPAL
jgi:hypothetical protein